MRHGTKIPSKIQGLRTFLDKAQGTSLRKSKSKEGRSKGRPGPYGREIEREDLSTGGKTTSLNGEKK